MAGPRVLILVLNYNAGKMLETCLRSLLAATYRNERLVVLDNGSRDGSFGYAKKLDLEVREYGENLGYCAAYNRAFEEFGGDADYFLLSNPDLTVPPKTIERMVAVAESDEAIGFVGPLQRHSDTREVRSAGIVWRCGRLPVHATRPGEKVEALEGAFLLVRKAVVEKVGGLDERFGLNLEDIEWQMRAAKSGFRSELAPGAEILHRPPGKVRRHQGAYYQTRNACLLTREICDEAALGRLRRRLLLEGIVGRILFRPRAKYILRGLADFGDGVTGMAALR